MSLSESSMGRRRALKYATVGAGAATAATIVGSPGVAGAQTGDPHVLELFPTSGDRSGEINDVINACADLVQSGSFEVAGGIVRLAPGNYNLNNPIVLRENVALVGSGAGTRLRAASALDFMIDLPGDSHSAAVRELRMLGSNNSGGIRVRTASGGQFSNSDALVSLENIVMHNMGGTGVMIGEFPNNGVTRAIVADHVIVRMGNTSDNAFELHAADSILSNCDASGQEANFGFLVTGSNNRILGCKAFFMGSDGFRIDTSSRTQIVGCQAQDNFGHGFRIQDGDDLTASACGADSNHLDGIEIRRCNFVAMNGLSVHTRGGAANGGQHVRGVHVVDSTRVQLTGTSRQNAREAFRSLRSEVERTGLLTDDGS